MPRVGEEDCVSKDEYERQFQAQNDQAEAPPAEEDAAGTVLRLAQSWLYEAMDLRAGVPCPATGAPHTVVYEALVTARRVQDRVETLLSLAIGFKGACEIRARQLEAEADDAWDDQAEAEKKRGTYGRREFEGAQERYAYWRLAVRVQRHQARVARELASAAGDVERRIRHHYYGLDGARQDLSRRMTALMRQTDMES